LKGIILNFSVLQHKSIKELNSLFFPLLGMLISSLMRY